MPGNSLAIVHKLPFTQQIWRQSRLRIQPNCQTKKGSNKEDIFDHEWYELDSKIGLFFLKAILCKKLEFWASIPEREFEYSLS